MSVMRCCARVTLLGLAAFITTWKVKDVLRCKRWASDSGTSLGCSCIVTDGQKVFHDVYKAVSRRMDQIIGAGAAMVVRAKMGSIVSERDTIFVLRPLEGGQALNVVLVIS